MGAPELTNAEIQREALAIVECSSVAEKHPGYWHGSAMGHVNYWRERAIKAETEVRRLRALGCGP